MQDPEALAATWTDGALVFVDGAVRPAAFVYPRAGGLAWVEPSYANPDGTSSPALHSFDGQLVDAPGRGISVVMADGREITVLPNIDGDDLVGGALSWFTGHLNENGLQWQAERERVRELIAQA